MDQLTIEEYLLSRPKFQGADYDHERDNKRLSGQILRVYSAMKDGAWKTIAEIAAASGDPENSVSAQFRNLRKKQFGSHVIERRHIGNGLYQYRMGAKQD